MSFDPLVEERVSSTVTVPRDDKGDPQIIPRGEQVPVSYTRASGLSDFLTYQGRALSDWRGRYEAQGIARRRDLAARIAAVHYSTGPLTGTMPITARKAAAAEIDACREEAAEFMGISEAANLGTAGHSLTEPENHDGQTNEELADVVAGYNEITAGLERVASEVFVANDALRSAGTFDSAYLDMVNFPGCVLIGDTKTGKNYHQAEFEMQLAVYQGGEVYLGDGGRLTFEEFFGLPVNADVAYLVHVSVTGSPKPRIVKLDLARGRRLAALAAATRDGRRELDTIGIGEKVDHKALAKAVMEHEWDKLYQLDEPTTPVEAMTWRLQAITLYRRFKTVWPDEYSAEIKRRTEGLLT